MQIESDGIPGTLLAEYAAIPIAFQVGSALSAQPSEGRGFTLTEHLVNPPYIKDYDKISEPPEAWADRFDTSMWHMWLARVGNRGIGGVTVALGTSGLDILEGRSDLAVLWDLRVAPALRGRGVGRALFLAASSWARGHGCTELKVETQNINAPACRFYAALGCQLRTVRADAYPRCPGEVQFLWYRSLSRSTTAVIA
jgi:GNAT superfamily N-acetyltransferase